MAISTQNELKKDIEKKQEEGNWFEQISADIVNKVIGKYLTNNGLRVFDVSYIEFNALDENTRSDDVIPLVYLFVDGGTTDGLKVRVKYGKDPAKQSVIYGGIENIENWINGTIWPT